MSAYPGNPVNTPCNGHCPLSGQWRGESWSSCMYRVVCPNFGHPALKSSFTKFKSMQVKNSFATRVNKLSVLKLYQLSNGDLLFSKHDYSLYKVGKPRMTKLGQGVGVRAHYPNVYCMSYIHVNGNNVIFTLYNLGWLVLHGRVSLVPC